ncbi:MAG: response regulator [Kiritimatiellia bacterium]|jgi:DNA-binding NtrC family response regulator|nr:response regulator [Kiritimatiellia bacterium]MDP6810836.1 response regulator [Kiritimatiellia bacterium]MDP7024178.1 response regulator [Kiritimatiellia bacterium]
MSEILIVDDELSIRTTLKEFLVGEGHSVEVAADEEEAVRLAKQHRFDLVLLDIILKHSSGTDLMHEFRLVSPRTRIVLMTGYPTVESLAEAIRFGVTDYLFKPIDKDGLIMAVRRALNSIAPFGAVNYAIA